MKNLMQKIAKGARKAVAPLLIAGMIGFNGCKNKYVEFSQDTGNINIDVVNELPSYYFAQSDFFTHKFPEEHKQDLNYKFSRGLIRDGKYTDLLRLTKIGDDGRKELSFVDFGQDGIVDMLISEIDYFGERTHVQFLDLGEEASSINGPNRQETISRQYQNLVERIN